MESPVVLEKPPEYYSKSSQNHDKGFPFDEEEGADGAWSDLAARHPDIAARLRSRPSTWARKRRSSHNNPGGGDDEFGAGLGEHFNRFPFDDIPPEFREHFPSHWNQRRAPQERTAPQPQQQQQHQQQAPQQPQQQPVHPQQKPPQNTISTQTEDDIVEPDTAGPSEQHLTPPSTSLPQYGLRNTVDLGQKTPADPSLVDGEEDRNQRSMSAPPDHRVPTPGQHSMSNMMGGNNQPPPQHEHQQHQSDHHSSQSTVRHIPIFVEGRDEPIINKAHPEPATHTEHKPTYAPPPPEREQYFERDPTMGFHNPPNFSRAFGTPFNKGFRQGPQPFAQQKGFSQPQNSPPKGRSQSPKPQNQQYTQIPVHHQQPPQQQRQQSPQPHQAPPPPQQAPPTPQQAPPPQQAPVSNDPIAKILSIQKDVLDLMTEVENFVGKKADKRYIYLDEMLTRNLIKLDDIETEGKENIRQARKEAIKCIQKCIAVLEAKADGKIPTTPQPTDVVLQPEENGVSESSEQPAPAEQTETKENKVEPAAEPASSEIKEGAKASPKKTKKVVKKRDKSKDDKGANGDERKGEDEAVKESDKMQVDEKGDTEQAAPAMDTESAVTSQ